MICPNCNHENPSGNKFCAECGTKLEANPSTIECPNCHNQVPADSKFCPDCGYKMYIQPISPKDYDNIVPDFDLVHIIRKVLKKKIVSLLNN